jgi:hypothetical protein
MRVRRDVLLSLCGALAVGCGSGGAKSDSGSGSGAKAGQVQEGGTAGGGGGSVDAGGDVPAEAASNGPDDGGAPADAVMDAPHVSGVVSDAGSSLDGGAGADPLAPGFCEGRWCWSNPLPQGNFITDIWAHAPNDVWASGQGNTILHWDGANWRRVSLGASPLRRFTSLWGTPDGVHQYVVGYRGGLYSTSDPVSPWVLLHNDGQSWRDEWPATAPKTSGPSAVSGTAPDDIWVVGDSGLTLHGDGQQFTVLPSSINDGLVSVTAIGRKDVWAGAYDNAMFHFDGQSWTPFTIPYRNIGVTAIWSAGSDVWASASDALLHWSGSAWATVPGVSLNLGTLESRGSGTGPRDIWVADRYQAHHFDGDHWLDLYFGGDSGFVQPAVRAIGPNDAWLGGFAGQLLHFDGQAFSKFSAGPLSGNLAVVGTSGAADVLVTGSALLQHSASGWTQLQQPGLADFVSTGPSDVWGFTTAGELFHWDGHAWSSLGNKIPAAPPTLLVTAVAGTGPGDLWAFNHESQVFHYDGQTGTKQVVSPSLFIEDAWAQGPNDVWVVGGGSLGDNAAIDHFTMATGWQAATVPAMRTLRGVWGSSPSDIWVVGSGGGLAHFDGGTWQAVAAPTLAKGVDLYAVAGRSSKDVWVVGQFGFAMHWDGTSWEAVDTGCGEDLAGVWVSPAGDAWAVGAGGAILHFR